MRAIAAPPSAGHPDRFLKCQEAIDDAFALVASTAIEAGWDREEVASALVELADNYILALLSERDLQRQLAALKGP